MNNQTSVQGKIVPLLSPQTYVSVLELSAFMRLRYLQLTLYVSTHCYMYMSCRAFRPGLDYRSATVL